MLQLLGFAADDQGAPDIYLTKCAKCHKFYDPKDYEDADWTAWMVKMKKKAHLSDEQYREILDYTDKLRKGETG